MMHRTVHAGLAGSASAALLATALLSACAPTPSISPSSTDSPRVIAFVAIDSDGGSPVSVMVVDLSGELSDARPATAAELTAEIDRGPMEGAAGGVSRAATSDRAILAIWGGARCDTSATLTVSVAASSLVIAPGRPSDCEAGWTYRGAVLTFDRSIDPGDIDLVFR